MPETAGTIVHTVADVVKVLTHCSSAEANSIEAEICNSPTAQKTFVAACGLSTAAIGYGGKIMVAGLATGGTASIGGAVLTAAGVKGAKVYCNRMLQQYRNAVK